jgi:hypothetical protein
VIARRLLAAGGGVTALLVVAGLASHGRPLSGRGGSGPSATFFDYVATTLFIVAAVMFAVFLYGLLSQRSAGRPRERSPWYLLSTLVSLAAAALIATLILRAGFANGLTKVAEQMAQQHDATRHRGDAGAGNVRDARIRWDEIAVVAALLGGTALVLLARRRSAMPRPWLRGRHEAVSLALDESLDDLRGEQDLRRAIIAAYARMERALAGAGLPRRPSEAPFEYVERALTSFDASAESAARLTTLFEWAKFSQHEPRPEMRDEAIEALAAVRDELRRPLEEPVRA